MPPTQVLVGIALFMSFFIMAPTFQEVNKEALTPLFEEKITLEQAYEKASGPFKDFMSKTHQAKGPCIISQLCRNGDNLKRFEDIPFNGSCTSFCY